MRIASIRCLRSSGVNPTIAPIMLGNDNGMEAISPEKVVAPLA